MLRPSRPSAPTAREPPPLDPGCVVTVLVGVIAGYTASHGGKTYQASSSILVSPSPEGQSNTLGIGTGVDTGDPACTIQMAAALIDTSRRRRPPRRSSVTDGRRGRSRATSPSAHSAPATWWRPPLKLQTRRTPLAWPTRSHGLDRLPWLGRSKAGRGRAGLARRAPGKAGRELGRGPGARDDCVAAANDPGPDREPTLSVSQLAAPPGAATGTSTWLIVLLALAGGFVLGSVAALALET